MSAERAGWVGAPHFGMIGAGALGREAWAVMRAFGTPLFGIGIYDDTARSMRTADGQVTVLPRTVLPPELPVIIAIADPAARRAIGEAIRNTPARLGPSYVAGSATVAGGLVALPGAAISADAVVGAHCVMGFCSLIGHDVRLGDYCTLSSHVDLCGGVEVGDDVFFGSGARALPGVRIGRGAYIGAGSVVVRNVEPGERVFGNPARRMA